MAKEVTGPERSVSRSGTASSNHPANHKGMHCWNTVNGRWKFRQAFSPAETLSIVALLKQIGSVRTDCCHNGSGRCRPTLCGNWKSFFPCMLPSLEIDTKRPSQGEHPNGRQRESGWLFFSVHSLLIPCWARRALQAIVHVPCRLKLAASSVKRQFFCGMLLIAKITQTFWGR